MGERKDRPKRKKRTKKVRSEREKKHDINRAMLPQIVQFIQCKRKYFSTERKHEHE